MQQAMPLEGRYSEMWQRQMDSSSQCIGTKDGSGAGDHDEPYRFGRKPRADVTFPFSERQ
jgi:hypothetical protein